MADQSNSEPGAPLVPAQEDGERQSQLGFTGENILSLLHKAADLADGKSRYAVDVARRLSHQLSTAENRVAQLESRIAELEAEVQHHLEKSERAEQWLSKISHEIQERVTTAYN
jgi:CII-binding regulator of phage lambda lysogenization HflD